MSLLKSSKWRVEVEWCGECSRHLDAWHVGMMRDGKAMAWHDVREPKPCREPVRDEVDASCLLFYLWIVHFAFVYLPTNCACSYGGGMDIAMAGLRITFCGLIRIYLFVFARITLAMSI